MDTGNAIEKLRQVASKDPVALDIFKNFAKRDRVWDSVSLRPLWLSLRESGLKHSVGQVAEVLGVIASTGIGKKSLNPDGRVGKITNMALDLRALGEAVIGDSKNLKKYLQGHKDRNLKAVAETVTERPAGVKIYPFRQAGHLSITLTINGKPVSLTLPDNLGPDELAAIVERLRKIDDK